MNAGASGTVNYWANAAGDLLWSNPLNWSNNVAASSTDAATFDSGFGATNGPGLVNNIVDLDTTVQQLRYSSVIPAYHTTLINPGVTLTVYDPTLSGEIFAYRAGGLSTDVSQVAIRGAGRLVVGDTNNPATVSGAVMIRVNNASTTPGPYWATLDMSELDYFACAPSEIRVGASGSSAGTQGTWIMAKTNLVIVGSTSGSSGYVGMSIGLTSATSAASDYPSAGDVQLGQENVLQLAWLKVGASRATNTSLAGPGGGVGGASLAGAGGTMEFRSGLVNPTLTMRGVDGVSALGNVTIGDNYFMPNVNTTNTATGVMDLSGGTVDALLTNLQIGRNNPSTTTTRTGSGQGELTWTAGTIEVTGMVRLGVQLRDNAGNATGVINVRSNAVLNLTGSNFSIGGDAGTAAGTGNGTLNIVYGGVVMVAGSITETNGPGNTSGTSTINLINGALSVGGLVRVDALSADNAVLSLTAGPTINAANPVCDVSNLTLATSVTLNVTGSVSLAQYPLIRYQGSIGGNGYGVVALGSLPPDVSGYLTNNTANGSIDLVVTSVPAVKWAGTLSGDWDINLTTNWISTLTSAATTYQETSIPGDVVIFDDTATGTKTVNLTTILSPATVIVVNTAAYVFTGTGQISGSTGLTKTGSGTLELANSGVNDYTGATTVGGGTLLVNSTLSGSAVAVQAGATLGGAGTIYGPVTIGSGGTLTPGNGIGSLTIFNNLVLSAGSTNVFEVNTDTLACDTVGGINSLTYGGTLVISGTGSGAAYTSGAAIPLFSAGAFSGAFSAIVPAYPAPGLYWDTSTLASDGALRIQAIPEINKVSWTNVAGGNLLWSNPMNWVRTNDAYPGGFAPNVVPTANDIVHFGSTGEGAFGATNVPGAVNNVVDVDMTVTNLYYFPIVPSYHTTLINPGVTLSVQDPVISGQVFGLRGNVLPNTTLLHTAIRGAGRLVVGDVNNPSATSTMRVNAASHTPGPYWATLDMSDLNTFECGVGEIRVGASGSSAGTQGTWIMAKTNLLVLGTTSGSSGYVGMTIGLTSSSGDFPSAGDVQLGQENVLRLHSLIVGRTRATNVSLGGPGGGVGGASLAGAGGAMEFRSGLVNPTLTIRGIDGVSPMPSLLVGDNNYVGAYDTTNTATGVMDLSGGTVDILASGLYVGRNNANTTTSRTGSGNGVLTWTAGTIEVTNLVRVGVQAGNNAGNATGVLNVQNSAVLNVTGPTFNLGNDAGSAAGTGNGTLNIVNGGVVTAAGDIAEINGTDGDGTSAINLTNGYLAAGGTVTVDNVNLMSGVISNTGTLTVSTLAGEGTIGGPVAVLRELLPGAPIGTLSIFNDLVLSATSTNVFEVNLDTLAADQVAGLNHVTLDGTLVVKNVGGTGAVANGTTLQLFSAASYQGAFAATDLPALSGFTWDTSGLANGTLKIVTGTQPVPTNITVQVTGTTLTLGWPASHLGWYVQSNAVGVANPGSWYDIPGSQLDTSLDLTINPAGSNVFYRLRSP